MREGTEVGWELGGGVGLPAGRNGVGGDTIDRYLTIAHLTPFTRGRACHTCSAQKVSGGVAQMHLLRISKNRNIENRSTNSKYVRVNNYLSSAHQVCDACIRRVITVKSNKTGIYQCPFCRSTPRLPAVLAKLGAVHAAESTDDGLRDEEDSGEQRGHH